jgi:ATP-dependent 26S proteasome regulatory subunit
MPRELSWSKELDLQIRSRVTLIHVVTLEEGRVRDTLVELCLRRKRVLYHWDLADGLKVLSDEQANLDAQSKNPEAILERVTELGDDAILFLPDFHQVMRQQPRILRKLRNLAYELKYTRQTIVMTAPNSTIPEELRDQTALIEVPLPNVDELSAILDELGDTPGVIMDVTPDEHDRIVRSALGLSANQAQRIFARVIVADGTLDADDIPVITAEKKQIIRESLALEYISPDATLADVGGLDNLKHWLRVRGRAFSQKAREYGLPEPKGVALIGISGTGKSLTAKTIAGLWGMPLIRLDIGAIFGSLVGQSEENIRRALSLAETASPCVLWIDEIEKGLSSGGLDGGTSMRVLGSILSWMQEKNKPVFVAATANDISKLPTELLRRGRFDEIFFLDLPSHAERVEIFRVHIAKRGRDPEGYDLELLAAQSDGYVGAEIEQAVIDAMFIAFSDPDQPAREFTTADIITALKDLVPIKRSQAEKIEEMRQFLLEGRAKSAGAGKPLPQAIGVKEIGLA